MDIAGGFEFLVQGSSAEPYRVFFRRRDAKNISAYCDCAAGENGMYCKHRIRILRGQTVGVVSDNLADVAIVASWLAGSDVELALARIALLEDEAARIKHELSEAKKALCQCLLD